MLNQIVQLQKEWFGEGHTNKYTFRKEQLLQLKRMLNAFESPMIKALKVDLNKSEYEGYTTEIAFLKNEINEHLKHLKKWMAPRKVKTPLTHLGSKNYILKEPYGTVLVIGPWNYPIQLTLAPVIGAIAAGNTVIIKPSEQTPTVSSVIRVMIEQYFPKQLLSVAEGGPEVTEELLDQPLNYIFFTGSVSVGKNVMEKASKRLIPVTLELGGKSPVIVNNDASIDLAAKRIVWGKFINAGQTCIAPDYLYVQYEVKDKLIQAMKKYIHQLYGEYPLDNPNYVKIINDHHLKRLISYLRSGSVVDGGDFNTKNKRIEPTILDGVTWEDPVMQNEIFGPILPILTFDHLDEVIKQINRVPKPLALYYFGQTVQDQQLVTHSISFGGGCINDTLYHFLNPNLAFGGVGESGMGSYHGKASFQTFTHEKSITKQTTKFDHAYRYSESKWCLALIKRILG